MSKTIQWYFDFISPFAYLQLECLHLLPKDVQIDYRPVLFAGLLSHWSHKGPAEIPQKRLLTYRHVQWLAQSKKMAFKFPPTHPFNPLKTLRLALALDCKPEVIKSIFHFIWREGNDAEDGAGWQKLTQSLGIADAQELISRQQVKDALRQNVEKAVEAGVFGVPTFVADGYIFWGFDTTEMLADYLRNPDMFVDPEMQRIEQLPWGSAVKRR